MQEGMRNRTEPAEPNRTEPNRSIPEPAGTGRGTEPNRTETSHVVSEKRKPNRVEREKGKSRTEPNRWISKSLEPKRIEPNRFLPVNGAVHDMINVDRSVNKTTTDNRFKRGLHALLPAAEAAAAARPGVVEEDLLFFV